MTAERHPDLNAAASEWQRWPEDRDNEAYVSLSALLKLAVIMVTQERAPAHIRENLAKERSRSTKEDERKTGNQRSVDSLDTRAHERSTGPPKWAEGVIFFLAPKDLREILPGDLEEEYYEKILPRFGERVARYWYWTQVLFSIGPMLRGHLLNWLGLRIRRNAARRLGQRRDP